MRSIVNGITGWASIQRTRTPELRTVDTVITAVGTVLIALTWVIVHG